MYCCSHDKSKYNCLEQCCEQQTTILKTSTSQRKNDFKLGNCSTESSRSKPLLNNEHKPTLNYIAARILKAVCFLLPSG